MPEGPPKQVESTEAPTHEELLAYVTDVAAFLHGKGNVIKVGIFGSFARGKEKPSDIDMVVLIDQEKMREIARAEKEIREYHETHGAPDEQTQKLTQQMLRSGLDAKEFNQLSEVIYTRHARESSQVPINVSYFPINPDSRYLTHYIMQERDPTFLENATGDLMIYDPASGDFKRENPFSEKVNRQTRKMGFLRMKQLVEGKDDAHLDEIERTPRKK